MEQGCPVIPAEGVEDGVAVGVADHRVHGEGHAVVGHAGPDGLGHFAQDLGLLRLIPQEKAEGLDRGLQRPGCAGGAEGGGDDSGDEDVDALFVGHPPTGLRGGGQEVVDHGLLLFGGKAQGIELAAIVFHGYPSFSNRVLSCSRPRRSWVLTVDGRRPRSWAISGAV